MGICSSTENGRHRPHSLSRLPYTVPLPFKKKFRNTDSPDSCSNGKPSSSSPLTASPQPTHTQIDLVENHLYEPSCMNLEISSDCLESNIYNSQQLKTTFESQERKDDVIFSQHSSAVNLKFSLASCFEEPWQLCSCAHPTPLCDRSNKLPTLPSAFWEAFLSPPTSLKFLSRCDSRCIALRRFASWLSFYCCSRPRALETDSVLCPWYKERQRARACLYFAEQLLNESYLLFFSHTRSSLQEKFSVLPTDVDMNDYDQWISIEQGGIEGPSMVPLKYRGNLFSERPNTKSDGKEFIPRDFRVAFELEPLCSGLLWKRMLCSGLGWRRPGFRSIVTLRYFLFSAFSSKCPLNIIIQDVQSWNVISLVLLDPLIKGEISISEEGKMKQALLESVLNTFSVPPYNHESNSSLFYLIQTLIHVMIIASKTMAQGEICALGSPWFNCFFPSRKDCFLLLLSLETWSFVTPLATEISDGSETPLLVFDKYYRTFDLRNEEYPLGYASDLVHCSHSPTVDHKPTNDSIILADVAVCCNSSFPLRYTKKPEVIQFQPSITSVPHAVIKAISYFTLGSTGFIRLPIHSIQGTLFCSALTDHGKTNIETTPHSSQSAWFYLKLVKIDPIHPADTVKLFQGSHHEKPMLFPLAQYATALNALCALDNNFYEKACSILDDVGQFNKELDDETEETYLKSVCEDVFRKHCGWNHNTFEQEVDKIKNLLDRDSVNLSYFNLSPTLLITGNPSDILDAIFSILYETYFKPITLWKCHPSYMSMWKSYQALSKHLDHQFILQPYTCVPMVLGKNHWVCISTIPSNTHLGLRDLIKFLSQWRTSRETNGWTDFHYSLLKREVCCLKNSVFMQSDGSNAIVQSVLQPPTMSLQEQALNLLYPHGIQCTLVLLPSIFSLWKLPFPLPTSYPLCSFLHKKIQLFLVSSKTSSDPLPTSFFTTQGCLWNISTYTIEYLVDYKTVDVLDIECLHSFQSFLNRVLYLDDFCERSTCDDTVSSLYDNKVKDFLEFSKETDPDDCTHNEDQNLVFPDIVLSYGISRNIFVFTWNVSPEYLDPYNMMPCSAFLRELRENLSVKGVLKPCKSDHTALSDSLNAFLRQWPSYSIFKRVSGCLGQLETLCYSLQHYLVSTLLDTLPHSLFSILDQAQQDVYSCFQLCAPLAAAVLIKHTIALFKHFMIQIRHSELIGCFRTKFSTFLASCSLDQKSQPSHIRSLFTLFFLLLHPNMKDYFGDAVQRIFLWASKLPMSQLIYYVFGKHSTLYFNGTSYLNAMYLRLSRGLFLNAIINNNSDNFFFPKEIFGHISLEPLIFAVLNTTSICHSYKRFVRDWFEKIKDLSMCLPTWSDTKLLLSMLKFHQIKLPYSFIEIRHCCTLLVLLIFRSLMSFDPWLGSLICLSSSSHISLPSTLKNFSSHSLVLTSLGEWLTLSDWIEPLLFLLNKIILDNQWIGESDAVKTLKFPSYLVALLLVSNALFELYRNGDVVMFENYIRRALCFCHSFPELTLFCCSSLIILHYIIGSGQEEIEETREWAFIFRLIRQSLPITPFHIGLPQPCPYELCYSKSTKFPHIPYILHKLNSSITFPMVYSDEKEKDFFFKSILKEVLPECSSHYEVIKQKKSEFTETSSNWSLVEHLLWNLTTFTTPDLFLWFDACIFRPLSISLQTDFSLNNHQFFHQDMVNRKVDIHVRKTSQTLSGLPSSRFLDPLFPSVQYFQLTSKFSKHFVLTCGNNAIAGSLGAGLPRFFKHEEALYDIAPEFYIENSFSALKGVDIWCAGNPIAIFLDDEPLRVAAGEYHTLVLTKKTYKLYAWGCNQYGQCNPCAEVRKECGRWTTRLFASLFSDLEAKHNPFVSSLRWSIPKWMNTAPCIPDCDPLNSLACVKLQYNSQTSFSSKDRGYYSQSNRLETAILEPQQVKIPILEPNDPLIDVFAGATFSIARTASGRLWLWGSLWDGCLARYSNSEVQLLNGHDIALAFLHQASEHTSASRSTVLDTYFTSRLHRIRRVTTGTLHVAALDCFGGLWLWGQSEAGQLGLSPQYLRTLTARYPSLHSMAVCLPNRLRLFIYPVKQSTLHSSSNSWSFLSTHKSFWSHIRDCIHLFLKDLRLSHALEALVRFGHLSCRVSLHLNVLVIGITDMALYNWSQLDPSHFLSPSPIRSGEIEFKMVSCGEGHTVALGIPYNEDTKERNYNNTQEQWLFSWGQNKYSQLGLENPALQWSVNLQHLFFSHSSSSFILSESEAKWTPCIVSWPNEIHKECKSPVIDICSGGCSNAALFRHGQVAVWGSNDFGVLGFNERRYNEISVPRLMKYSFRNKKTVIRRVVFSIDGARSYFILRDGTVFCFGKDHSGASGCYIDNTANVKFLSESCYPFTSTVNRVEFPSGYKASLLVSGIAHTVFIPVLGHHDLS